MRWWNEDLITGMNIFDEIFLVVLIAYSGLAIFKI